jgi:hypothetical protein
MSATTPHILKGRKMASAIGIRLQSEPEPDDLPSIEKWRVYRSKTILAIVGPGSTWLRVAPANMVRGKLPGTPLELAIAKRACQILRARRPFEESSKRQVLAAWKIAAAELGADPEEFPI